MNIPTDGVGVYLSHHSVHLAALPVTFESLTRCALLAIAGTSLMNALKFPAALIEIKVFLVCDQVPLVEHLFLICYRNYPYFLFRLIMRYELSNHDLTENLQLPILV